MSAPRVVVALLLLAVALPASAQDDEFSLDEAVPSPEEAARRQERLQRLTRPTSEIELGAWYVSDDEFKFGDYTGLEDQSFEALANLDLRRSAPWDGDDTWHWRLWGENLALRSRGARLEGGMQGLFDAWVGLQEFPRFLTETAMTPYRGADRERLTLPPDWIASTDTTGFLNLGSTLRQRDIRFTREHLDAGAALELPRHFSFEGSYLRQSKDGRRLGSTVIGSTGGNPRGAIVPEPIDWTTDDVDVALRYDGDRAQARLGYYRSAFDDHDDSLTWSTAFLRPVTGGTWDLSASYPTGLGRKALPPDNRFQQVSASGGLDLGFWETRLTGDVALGWLRQEDDFLPYTVNPTLAASVMRPLPRGELDGEIDTTAVNVRLDSQPLPGLRLRGGFRWDDRYNDTPRDLYIYVPGDARPQAGIDSSTARLNRPYDYELEEYRAEASYELVKRTELGFGWERDAIARSFQEVDETSEDTWRLFLRSRPARWLSLRAEGSRAARDGSDYDGARPFILGVTPEHLATIPPLERFENHPALRKFYLADRNRESIEGAVTVAPWERLSVGFALANVNEDYEDTDIGLLHARSLTWTLDLAFQPCDALTTWAFYSYEDFETRQAGHSTRGSTLFMDLADPTRRWSARDADSIDTWGVGFALELIQDVLTLETDWIYAHAKDRIRVTSRIVPTTPPLPGTPSAFPDAESHLWGASVALRYRVTPHWSVRGAIGLERLDVDDWAYDDVHPATLPRVLSSGLETPRYRTYAAGLSLIYDFR